MEGGVGGGSSRPEPGARVRWIGSAPAVRVPRVGAPTDGVTENADRELDVNIRSMVIRIG